jgi:pseudaminic acid synthase
MKIANRQIGSGHPCFIIAELSANHAGSIDVAIETIKAAKRAGADAIKFQTYTADTITLNSEKEDFVINQGTIWDGKKLHDLYNEAHLPWDWHTQLFEIAEQEELICFSSPFDKTAVDFLEELNVPAYKIASFEITDIPLIEYVASKGKPVIISTGIADENDIELALQACKRVGNDQIALLKCTSAYPAKVEDANLTMISDLTNRFKVVSGLSDHTLGTTVPVVSIAMGAHIIEKHFILNKTIQSADATFSLDENEFAEMVKHVRQAESSIGKVDYSLTESKKESRNFSRSLYVVVPIQKGETITEQNVKSIRPGYGMHPKHYASIVGKKAASDLEAGTPLSFDLLSD